MADNANSNADQEIIFDDTEEEYDFDTPTAFTPMRYDPLQRKVKDLHSDYLSKDLDPRPSFQRGYVWDKPRASKLIESILLNVPLPLIYTAEEEDQTEVVIDGQQRLLSVFGFVDEKFPRDQSKFRLTGLKFLTDLNGKTYAQLEQAHQRAIQRYIFQIIRISNESHADVKFEIFERLNSGSVTLNAQELRNCVYRGPFNDVLKRLAEISDFRTLLGSSSTTNRMQDVELVLRFLAFYEKTYLNYSGSMKSFLNDFMDEYKNLSKDKAKKFEDAFRQACSITLSVFGNEAFKKYSLGDPTNPSGEWERAINRPLFDVVMWGFTRFDKNQVQNHLDAIREALIHLQVTDPKFIDAITAAVGDKSKTQYRFEAWKTMLSETITSPQQTRAFSPSLRKKMFTADPTCTICGNTIHMIDDAHLDHIEPFSKGGATTAENCQLTHRFCNLRKSAST